MPRKLSPAKYKNLMISLERKQQKKLRTIINEWLNFMRKEIIRGLNREIRKDQAESLALDLTDWQILEERGTVLIKPAILEAIQEAGKNTSRLFAIEASFDILNPEAVSLAETITSKMITQVTDETRKGVSMAIRMGIERGEGIPKIAKRIKPLVGLTEKQVISVANFEEKLLIDKPHFKREQIDRAVNRYERKVHRRRSVTIARDQASRAINEGSLNVYESEGVDVEWIAVEGNDFDRENCQDNNGQVFTVAEARGRIPVHPNCECLWAPHVEVAAVAA
jgi:hypothetical protein